MSTIDSITHNTQRERDEYNKTVRSSKFESTNPFVGRNNTVDSLLSKRCTTTMGGLTLKIVAADLYNDQLHFLNEQQPQELFVRFKYITH